MLSFKNMQVAIINVQIKPTPKNALKSLHKAKLIRCALAQMENNFIVIYKLARMHKTLGMVKLVT